jgi:hypothetical protein
MRVTRRGVRAVLGVLWILDGLLQLQASMFTARFGAEVLAPAGVGQPWFVAVPVRLTARIVAEHPELWDLGFAVIQIGLGVAILIPALVRPALAASVAWSFGVWWLGEGLGGMASGHADFLTGAPGAVLLYAVVAAATWPPYHRPGEPEPTGLPEWLGPAWAALWLGAAALRLLPGQNTGGAIASEITDSADGAPGWLVRLDGTVAHSASQLGLVLVAAWVAVCVAVGLGGLRRGAVSAGVAALGVTVALACWVVGQAFGEPWSGTATDPNTAPLVVLLAVALVGIRPVPLRGRHRRVVEAAPQPRPRARSVVPPRPLPVPVRPATSLAYFDAPGGALGAVVTAARQSDVAGVR